MPIVVNPSFVWPPEVDPVVSPDGRITAIVDPAHAGVLLRADYSDLGDGTPIENLWRGSKLAVNRSSMTVAANATNTQIPDGLRITINTVNNAAHSLAYTNTAYRVQTKPNTLYSWRIRVRNSGTIPFPVEAQSWAEKAGGGNESTGSVSEVIAPGETRDVLMEGMQSGPDPKDIRWSLYYSGASSKPQPGAALDVLDPITLTATSTAHATFNGDTSATEDMTYAWTGAVANSTSLAVPIQAKLVARVRFERQDGTVVRSGNPAWAPGGYAHAYDHEATLGGGTLWRAVPIHFDGTEGTPSEYVGAVIPALSDGWAWLKPVADPNKAMLLKVEPPDLSYDGRVDTTSIAGSARPAATWDVLEGFTTQLRSLVREKAVADQLMALLDEGPVLAQFPACAGLPDFYFIRGKVDLEHVHWDGYPWRRYQWDVLSIDRPDTTDSPLRIPDLSYDTVERDGTTYDQLAATVDSYNKLLEP